MVRPGWGLIICIKSVLLTAYITESEFRHHEKFFRYFVAFLCFYKQSPWNVAFLHKLLTIVSETCL